MIISLVHEIDPKGDIGSGDETTVTDVLHYSGSNDDLPVSH